MRARIMAMGELLATCLGASFLTAQGIATAWVDARSVLHAEHRHGTNVKASLLSATCDFSPDERLQAEWTALDRVVITQGFIASNDAGDTVLLGRGGSDTSGAYFAAKLAAARLEIWTDVPGMFSANPRAVPTARLLRALHYDEAQEIASNGAKVLHPRCVLPVRQYRIPLHVYATQAPGLEGTVVRRGGRRQRRSGEGDRHQERHHAGLHGQPRHVAPGRIPGGCVPGVQGSGHVGRSGLDLRDQRHRLAGSRPPTPSILPRSRGFPRRSASFAACRSSDLAPR